MKKIFYYASALLFAGALTTTSCNKDDNDNTPSKEEREQKQQEQEEKEKEEAQKVDADLILDYTVDLTASAASYEGTKIEIEMDKIATALGFTKEEVIKGIEGKEGGAEVTTYYIESNGIARLGANTQVGASDHGWGHWLNATSDVTTWGEGQAGDYGITYAGQAVIWTSLHLDGEDDYTLPFVCEIGQYPAKLEEAGLIGKTYTIKEGIQFEDAKAVVRITVNIKGLEEIKADIIGSKDVEITTSVYDAHEDYLELDSTEILSAIGASNLDECTFVAVKADGSYAQEPDDKTSGLYWMNIAGNASGYADGNYYIGYYHAADNENRGKLFVGQYGKKLQVPESEGSETKVDFNGTIDAKWGVFYNNKIYMINVKINVAGYQDTETKPAGDPASSSKDYTMEKDYTKDYAAVAVDVKEQLQSTFKMTCYELYQAFAAGTLKMYAGETSADAPTYTANAPGYWLSAEGKGCAYAEGKIYAELKTGEYANQTLVLNIGNHPDNCTEGLDLPLKLFVTDGTTTATINIAVKVSAKPADEAKTK